ncbi:MULTISPECIES: outer membrane protein assembly factor BamD [Uliginosibacterium]|uniref:Outer membrane protein assembly factor BamD n=1 Tax=Uliginosibacterium aquaticum TaxID=2731212 RepID=A0ABX2IFI7_9RHOO|nr:MULTISPECIES: outer membrane protein assembly factor BamD [Uliginosibacterium]MDO6384860.1 outer membrane protein assembly factor BamD [Uliginosibacterium sp. 31-12]NSL55428.1 outer membrane protein assembly factor BamD [Uliginosibacterium aquaticum]PLK48544.1 outer membrane protein assembly factor BamD [Uliginosibacterium sp. TH139]
MFKFTLSSLPAVALLCLLTACATAPKPGSTAKDPQSAYAEAKEFLDAGSYESAITAYEQLEARFPYGRHAQQAQLDTAYAHYKMGEMDAVIGAAERFSRLHPNHPNVDYAYYLKGLAYENTKRDEWLPFLPQQPLSERDKKGVQNAFETFKQLYQRFPDSRYAADAHLRMNILLEALATHELNAARYYLQRRAPLAAANRAQAVVKTYSTSKSVEDALGLMIQSYRELQLETLRLDTERVLRQNYPNSRYLASK